MSNDQEIFRLPDGQAVGCGLLLPNDSEKLLMAQVAEYPDAMFLEDKDIERALVVNGQQIFRLKRKRRAKRIRNQSQLGKCNASSNVSGIENTRENQGMPDIALSDCHVYMGVNGGADRGSALITTFTHMQDKGVSPMEIQVGGMTRIMPNDAYSRRQVDPAVLKQADIEASRFKGWEFFKAPMDSYERYIRALASAVARDQQIVFAWHVGSGSMRLTNGYVNVGRGAGNHSNLIHSGKWVGGEDLVHFDDQNSWGPSVDKLYGPTGGQGWGEGGFGLFKPGDVWACARNHCTYIITSCRPDRNDPAMN